jgi:hypothetical protein
MKAAGERKECRRRMRQECKSVEEEDEVLAPIGILIA